MNNSPNWWHSNSSGSSRLFYKQVYRTSNHLLFVFGQFEKRKKKKNNPEPVCKFPCCCWDDLWFTSVNRLLPCLTFCCYSSLVFPVGVAGASSFRGQLHSDLPVSLNKSWRSFFVLRFQEVHRNLPFYSTCVLKYSFWPWCICSVRSDKWHFCRVC